MNFSIKSLIALFAVAGLAKAKDCDNLVDVACSNDDLTTLCAAVGLAGLEDALSSGHWTVFAPTDSAFEELGDTLDAVLADKDLLTDILLFHAVDDVVGSEDLVCTGLTEMANGKDSRTVCVGDKIFQKGGSNPRNDMPEIILADIKTCQGFVHVVDEVLLPARLSIPTPPKPECKSIAEIACSEENADSFSTLCTAVTQAGLGEALSGGEWTVFAPVNDAFAALGSTLNTVLADNDLLTNILLFHVVPGETLFSHDFKCTRRTEMGNGKDSRHVCVGADTFQKGAGNSRDAKPKIVTEDIGACNGVIHVVDQVLLP